MLSNFAYLVTPMRGHEGNKRHKYLPSKIMEKVNITSLLYKHGWKLIKFRLVMQLTFS